MAEAGFPAQHSTTVTTTSTAVRTDLRFDPNYVRTLPGILKCVQLVLNILGFICMVASKLSYTSRGTWFNTVAMGGFWFTGIMLCLYLYHVIERLFRIPWLKIELVFCAVWTLFYLIAAILAAGYASIDEAFGAAAFFGFCAMIAYGFDAFLKFQAVRNGEIAQGERSVTVTRT